MTGVLELTDRLEADLPAMLAEHKAIFEALQRLRGAAQSAGRADIVDFAQQLMHHARTEEEVMYPAAILVGKFVRERSRGWSEQDMSAIEAGVVNPIQSIAVHVDGTERAAVRLRIAHRLAAVHQAALTTLFAVAPHVIPRPQRPGDGMPKQTLFDEIDAAHRAHALGLFERLAAGASGCRWQELTGEPPIRGFVRHALVADLLVVGQHDPTDESGFDVPADFVESVIIGSGKPTLVVPCVGDATAEPQTVLIAWKPTREAARALTASLPFLRRAANVHVYCAAGSIVESREALTEVTWYLQQHRVAAVHEHHELVAGDVANGLLPLATRIGAQLLVMGCYGHSRARELVLGGASRTVLQSMTMPVLMVH
jgi:nucleotide-binding universal stress UspA family protein